MYRDHRVQAAWERAPGQTGADGMLITSAGLWIADDNYQNVTQCAGQYGHAGIGFLPYVP